MLYYFISLPYFCLTNIFSELRDLWHDADEKTIRPVTK